MNSSYHSYLKDDVICALATPPGQGAIAVVRVSGKGCLDMLDKVFVTVHKETSLAIAGGYTIHHGRLMRQEEWLDEVLVSVFRAPYSYTGEDAAEIGLHGSVYIQQKALELLVSAGMRMAAPGEFTMRAFLNGKYDLVQAEAVADLIASNTPSSHQLALNQVRGGFSGKIRELRQQLIDLAALLELELDFSEEDVEFADRSKLLLLTTDLKKEIQAVTASFSEGNVLKHGVPVAITGRPNVGKSTLLNAILNEERAIVSEIPGTTRDFIEDVLILEGKAFRFIDTAGLRDAAEPLESMGIERAWEKISQAAVILYVFDITAMPCHELKEELEEIKNQVPDPSVKIIPVGNKTDMLVEAPSHFGEMVDCGAVFVSAKRKENINLILETLVHSVVTTGRQDQAILSNVRHYEALTAAMESLIQVEEGLMQKRPTDLVAIDLRSALDQLGSITGEIVPDDILGSVFGRFCIGK